MSCSGCTTENAPKVADGYVFFFVNAGGHYDLWPNCGPPGCDLIEVTRDAIDDVLRRYPRRDGGN